MRITGIGGTGVVTVAQILGTASPPTGARCASLDQTGLAQKGGAVVSDLSVTRRPRPSAPPSSAHGECDLYLGCDALVATDGTQLRAASKDRTMAVVSTTEVPTAIRFFFFRRAPSSVTYCSTAASRDCLRLLDLGVAHRLGGGDVRLALDARDVRAAHVGDVLVVVAQIADR